MLLLVFPTKRDDSGEGVVFGLLSLGTKRDVADKMGGNPIRGPESTDGRQGEGRNSEV
jgi:hypothetical protein